MKIFEIVIDEAISVSHYTQALVPAINDGVYKAIGQIYRIKGRDDQGEENFVDDDASHNQFIDTAFRELKNNLEKILPNTIKDSLNNSLGVPIVQDVSFLSIDGLVRGWADGRDITFNMRFIDSIAKKAINVIFDSVYNSYNGEERLDGFYFTCRSIGSGDRYLSRFVDDVIKKPVTKLASTAVHELVHVLQHNRQFNKGKSDTEYRSYLDKYKGEFVDRHAKRLRNPDQSSNSDDDERYYNLYLASPQEIPAFAHQAALNIIDAFGFDEAEHKDDLAIGSVSHHDIVYAVNNITNGRFGQPKTPREAMVRKRYIKLVYQEVARYLQQRLEQLKSKTTRN